MMIKLDGCQGKIRGHGIKTTLHVYKTTTLHDYLQTRWKLKLLENIWFGIIYLGLGSDEIMLVRLSEINESRPHIFIGIVNGSNDRKTKCMRILNLLNEWSFNRMLSHIALSHLIFTLFIANKNIIKIPSIFLKKIDINIDT